MIENKKFNISELVSNYGCFDLQFRKDTRHKRTGSPTYYRWNTQFVITSPKEKIIPYFRKNQLSGKKKGDFNLWQKAVEIIYLNKGKSLLNWKRNEFLQLLEIHKSAIKYKEKPRQSKWIEDATNLSKTLK